MLEFLGSLSPFLLILIILFVILPALIAASIRITLYRYLYKTTRKINVFLALNQPPISKPQVLSKLEKEYELAIKHLEQVNTSALLDNIYSQEKFTFWDRDLPCDYWDNFCRVLPNLLLSLGLLGTFFGIAFNFYAISSNIYTVQDNTNIQDLIRNIRTPLQGMGIAFSTSFVALLFSSILIIVNSVCNTALAKYELLTSLEEYLDNKYKSRRRQDPGFRSPLDKAADRAAQIIADRQNQFLLHFNELVGDKLEQIIGKVIQEMIAENRESQKAVTQVINNLKKASSDFSNGVESFKYFALSLEKPVKIIEESAGKFLNNSQAFGDSVSSFQGATAQLEGTNHNLNATIQGLAKAVGRLEEIEDDFRASTRSLNQNLEGFIEQNNRTHQLAEQVYTEFQSASGHLERGADTFSEAVIKIEESHFISRFSESVDKLDDSNRNFVNSVGDLDGSIQAINQALSQLQDSVNILTSFSEEIKNLNQQSAHLIQATEAHQDTQTSEFSTIQANLLDLVDDLRHDRQHNSQAMKQIGDRFFEVAREQVGATDSRLQEISAQLNGYNAALNQIIQDLNRFPGELKHSFDTTSNRFEHLGSNVIESIRGSSNALRQEERNIQDARRENYQKLVENSNLLQAIRTELSTFTKQFLQELKLIKQEVSQEVHDNQNVGRKFIKSTTALQENSLRLDEISKHLSKLLEQYANLLTAIDSSRRKSLVSEENEESLDNLIEAIEAGNA